MPAVDLEMRSIDDDEVMTYLVAVDLGFGEDAHPDDEAVFRTMMPLDRTVAVFDGTEMVGTLGDWPLTVGIPGGGSLPMAGTTVVGVRSTHRRRGILRAMVERHLEMVVDRGEPLAGLWTSESAIYGRFGFGLANEAHEITIDTRLTSVPPGPSDITLQLVGGDDVLANVAPFWTSLTARRAGWIDRGEPRRNATVAGPELEARLEKLTKELGPYPHAAMKITTADYKKQSTRLIRVDCPTCGYLVRTTRRWLRTGYPVCPCGTRMEGVV